MKDRRLRRHLVGARTLGIAAATGALLATAAPALAAPPNVALTFDAPVAGTVATGDGQGTGFAGVQPNTAGNEYVPANARNLPLTRGGGAMAVRVRDGAGNMSAWWPVRPRR